MAVALRVLWKALEWALGDSVHWRVISRLLLIVLVIVVLVAVRQGWAVESKLDWLIRLFAPIFGAQLPQGMMP